VIAPASKRPLASRFSGLTKPSSRAAFRARLEDDPRRWVLALAAAEALVGFALTYDQKLSKPGPGYMLLVGLAFVLVSPAVGVAVLFVQGRILYWGGGLLGGKARPRTPPSREANSPRGMAPAAPSHRYNPLDPR